MDRLEYPEFCQPLSFGMVCWIASLLVLCLVTPVCGSRIGSRFFDASLVMTMEEKLQKDCGVPCIQMFHEMIGWLDENAESVLAGRIGPVNGSLAHSNMTSVTKEPWGLALLALAQRESQKVCCLC